MIIVRLMGGLGNQMFQYALGKALSLERGEDVIYDTSQYLADRGMGSIYQRLINVYHHITDDECAASLYRGFSLHHFNVKLTEETDVSCLKRYRRVCVNWLHKRLPKLSKLTNYTYLDEAAAGNKMGYMPGIFDISSKQIYLRGWWQTEKYFSKYRDEILSDFRIITPQSDINKSWSERIKCCNSVSLHVRRTDYVSIGCCLGIEYYRNAIEYISSRVEKPVFFIFSDDMQWVRDNLDVPYEVHYMDQNGQEEAYEDLRLMSECKHNVIANSSFAWWGAWLNQNPDKIIIAPKGWMDGASYLDILPDMWVQL